MLATDDLLQLAKSICSMLRGKSEAQQSVSLHISSIRDLVVDECLLVKSNSRVQLPMPIETGCSHLGAMDNDDWCSKTNHSS